jgi:formylglycine-generating enzyme required for sulfatase activity
MTDIFISYAREDRFRVEPLAKALEKSGWTVWWDQTIPPGKTFDQAIEEAIFAAKCVVVLWSQHSIKSDWVKEEASIGKQRNVLIPAKIDAVEIPLGFGFIQAADLTDWQSELTHPGYRGLQKAISSILISSSMESTKQEQPWLRMQSQGKTPDSMRKRGLVIGTVFLVIVLVIFGWLHMTMQEALTIPEPYTNSIGMTFVYIAPGTFVMGSPKDEPGRNNDYDMQQHQVILSQGFYMQTTEVTQRQWLDVMGNNPSAFKECGYDCPVENVSWDDVQLFIKKLNGKEGTNMYRLPTEAEWEYSARAGTLTPFAFGRCLSSDQANYKGDQPLDGCPKGLNRGMPVKVGSFQPNAWSLHDMHGNVSEWVDDKWQNNYKHAPGRRGTWLEGPRVGSVHVIRGGSWSFAAKGCRSAYRRGWTSDFRYRNLGFRLAFLPD